MVERVACFEGNLEHADRMSQVIGSDSAEVLHIRGAVSLILRADAASAVAFHRRAKAVNSTTLPPLAALNLKGETCLGLGDVFYVAAVVTKQLVDTNLSEEKLFDGHSTLVTLVADSGLHQAAEAHVAKLLELQPSNAAVRMRAALLTPGVFEDVKHVEKTRQLLEGRVQELYKDEKFVLKHLDEFVLSPTFYFVYQGYRDRELLQQLHAVYARAFPALARVDVPLSPLQPSPHQSPSSRVKIGFVSAHFRRHSICKLFCGLITSLDPKIYEVTLFSALSEPQEDLVTESILKSNNRPNFVRVGKTILKNRFEVVDRNIQILVYLDVGMDPATTMWAAARVAPVQICVWGHPSTTGLLHMDYFLSSELFHPRLSAVEVTSLKDRITGPAELALNSNDGGFVDPDAVAERMKTMNAELRRLNSSLASHPPLEWPAERFSEQLILFDSLGVSFRKPELKLKPATMSSEPAETMEYTASKEQLVDRPNTFYEDLLHTLNSSNPVNGPLVQLLENRQLGAKIILCPQHLPKFHPKFDVVLRDLLKKSKNSLLVLVNNDGKKGVWKKTILRRWAGSVGFKLLQRVVWLSNLNPQEYLSLLAMGDLMIDPFPFGGGVTTLESLGVCTPVITAPLLQTVPALAAGMLRSLKTLSHEQEHRLIVETWERYVAEGVRLLGKGVDVHEELKALRRQICAGHEELFEQDASAQEWNQLFQKLLK